MENVTFDYSAAVDRALDAATDYYTGIGITMTDAEYDALLVDIAAYEAEHPDETIAHGLFTEVAAGTLPTGDVTHPSPMLSLDKVTDSDGIRDFVRRVAAEQSSAERCADPVLSLTPKLDGMAIRAVYRGGQLVQVVTRGDGRTGEDITSRILRNEVSVAGLPLSVGSRDFEVRGELLMSRIDFSLTNDRRIASGKPGFANPRNATAGSVRAETLDYAVDLSFVCYTHDDAPANGFHFVSDLDGAGFYETDEADALIAAVEAFGAQRADYDYPTDGVVISVNSRRIRAELGEGSRAPKWAVAYKYEAQTGESVVRDIVVEVGRTGNLSFTAVFDPVFVDGSTISRASVHNVGLIAEKDIRIGSKVVVQKSHDIIPQIVSATNGPDTTPWVAPTEDEDGFPYEMHGAFLRSTNPAASVSALIAYAGSRDVLDIDTLGRSVADALVDAGLVNDLGDLFTVSFNQLESMPFGDGVYGEIRAARLYENIQAAKTQPLNRFITALGIRKSGRTFGRRLASRFHTFDALLAASQDDFYAVEGVGDERARLFHDGFARNREVIEKLRTAGVSMGSAPDASASALPLAGMAIVVSGGMTGSLAGLNRNEVQELIESLGGRASSSVSKNTSLLVTTETATSKAAKAAQLGVKVISPEEFAALIGR